MKQPEGYPVSYIVTKSIRWRQLSPSTKIMYQVLCMLSNEHGKKNRHGWFFRSNDDLAKDCGIHINSINNAKKELIEARLIQVTTIKDYNRRKATKYRVIKHKKLAQ